MKRFVTGILICAIVVVLAIALWLRRSPSGAAPPAAQTPPPARQPTDPAPPLQSGTGAVILVGVVQPERQAAISLATPARVVRVLVSAGDSVQKGALLATLDAAPALAQLNSARAAADAARAQWQKAVQGANDADGQAAHAVGRAKEVASEAKLRQQNAVLTADAALLDQQQQTASAREGLRKANLAAAAAHRASDQLRQLAALGGVSRNDIEAAQARLQAALADRTAAQIAVARAMAGAPNTPGGYPAAIAQTGLALAKKQTAAAQQVVEQSLAQQATTVGLGAADVGAAAAQLRQAEAGVQAAQTQLDQTDLRSPIAGIVTAVAVHSGETPQPGTPIINVESAHGVEMQALALARQIPLLRVGMAANVAVDTNPGRQYAARITQVADVAQPDGRTFRVQVRLIRGTLRPAQIAHIRIPMPNPATGR